MYSACFDHDFMMNALNCLCMLSDGNTGLMTLSKAAVYKSSLCVEPRVRSLSLRICLDTLLIDMLGYAVNL
jgi:hypothetical protein